MTGGAGFSRDAMNRTKQNRSLITKSREKLSRARSNKNLIQGGTYPIKDPEKAKQIIEKSIKERKAQNKKLIIFASIVILILLLAIIKINVG
ncbi:hypothetical protein [Robertkochia aurantiaca]|uniref:hypothetical protein n=1 Tax=Robertkochia aurantiaca TaxID=2873700 RepID=UPI001CCAEE8B|nr:hypothetical protein [Robertkochia sp. 3YJGBD-33]